MTTRARAFYLLKKSDKSDFIWLFKIRSTTLVWILEVVLFWVRWWQVRGIITHYYLTVGFPRYPPLAGNMNLVSLAWWTGMEWTSSDLVLSEEPVCLGWTILTQSLLWNKGTGIPMDMKCWSFVQCFSDCPNNIGRIPSKRSSWKRSVMSAGLLCNVYNIQIAPKKNWS